MSGAGSGPIPPTGRLGVSRTVEDIVRVRRDRQALLTRENAAQFTYVELQRRLQAIALGPVESRNFMVELAGQFAAKPD
ncbi:MAG: hypothetical protein JO309_17155 [Pseudonocardiales bacterium]|nr:hypothetical protein [Pseudonocardiales bacterium]MBV9731100.1 hypothetical protein [Pseudonocardiales bacterium]